MSITHSSHTGIDLIETIISCKAHTSTMLLSYRLRFLANANLLLAFFHRS